MQKNKLNKQYQKDVSMDGMRVYIAGPFFNDEQVGVIARIEMLLEKMGVDYFSPRSEGVLKKMSKEERAAKMGDVFKSNVRNMDWCTHCIAVTDGYDTGTVWEMGYLFATGKQIITFSNEYKGINVMLNESISAHCIYYLDLIEALEGNFSAVRTDEVT